METTLEKNIKTTIRGYIGIMEKKMETTIMGYILGLHRGNRKSKLQ